MSKHTPGPWTHEHSHLAGAQIRLKREHWTVGSAETRQGIAFAFHSEANARLIAAAPEMLQALRDLLAECDQHGSFAEVGFDFPSVKPVFDAARAAIAKAEQL